MQSVCMSYTFFLNNHDNFFCKFFEFFFLFKTFWTIRVYESNQILQSSLFWKFDPLNCPKNIKNEKFFSKNYKKNFFFFFEFLKFFISDRIYTPKIMINNLSHVLSSWLYTKKVCDWHTRCTQRPTKAPLCS